MLPAWVCHTHPEGSEPSFHNKDADNRKAPAVHFVLLHHPYPESHFEAASSAVPLILANQTVLYIAEKW